MIKAIFSKATGVVDSNAAELLDVWEILQIFVTSKWATSYRLIIESDSSNVVKWVLNPQGWNQGSWRFADGKLDIYFA
ncbi:hypothetical protein CRYUN_Cryun01aG0072400 [Craigia yunnanensis]